MDGMRAFLFRRSLQNAADGSALVGAGEVDVDAFYGTDGREVVLDPLAARRAALDWLARRRLPVQAAVATDSRGLRVRLQGRIDTGFLALVGLQSIVVAAEARAEPVDG